MSIRWGLCCLVLDAPIRFRAATHAYVARLDPSAGRAYLEDAALHNVRALRDAIEYCRALGIGAFRITSGLLPLATHPQSGFTLDSLGRAAEVRRLLAEARDAARAGGIRLSFHPDQFVVLNSARPDVVESALGEIEWQATLAELLDADVICLHGGSVAGGVDAAAERLLRGIDRLSPRARSRLALENDDRCWPAIELLPVCLAADIPLVLDAHHHRVLDGGLSLEDATAWALATWGTREPYFHLSSPREGWGARNPRPHADYIDPEDLPAAWLSLDGALTVDVEAKAKERAVLAVSRAARAAHARRNGIDHASG
jgi:UV DNA damage endonuclease